MKAPFAYVLYIERDTDEHLVLLHQSLDETEDALRDYARTIVVSPSDDEIVEVLAEHNIHARIYACAMKRNTQISTELKPFTRIAKVA